MSIEHELTVNRYEQFRQDIVTAMANLREFAESLLTHMQ